MVVSCCSMPPTPPTSWATIVTERRGRSDLQDPLEAVVTLRQESEPVALHPCVGREGRLGADANHQRRRYTSAGEHGTEHERADEAARVARQGAQRAHHSMREP